MAVALKNHGGQCCGMRHIHNFRNEDVQQDIRELRQLVREEERSVNLEVILSNRQATEKPQLIAALSELGFAYTTAWRGNHGTPVHLFHLAPQRLPLEDQRFGWAGEMNRGVLGNVADEAPLREGDVVIFQGPSAWRNRLDPVQRTILSFGRNPVGARIARFEDAARRYSIVVANCIRDGNQNAAPPAPVRTVLAEYFALFRTGRKRGPFQTLAEVAQAYPRVARYSFREVLSDGTINEREERMVRRDA